MTIIRVFLSFLFICSRGAAYMRFLHVCALL
jgi:hypothetical protein